MLGGRVWLRRDLYWVGFALWALLLLAERRRRRGITVHQRRLGAVFRFSFLAAILAAPSLALAVLAPAGAVALLPVGGRPWRRAKVGLMLLPATALLAVCLLAALRGTIAWWSPPAISLGLLAVALVGLIRPALTAN